MDRLLDLSVTLEKHADSPMIPVARGLTLRLGFQTGQSVLYAGYSAEEAGLESETPRLQIPPAPALYVPRIYLES